MAVFPTITSDSPVEITTNSPSLTYQMLLNTLNYMAYKVHGLYLQAPNNNQVSTQFGLQKLKHTGQLFLDSRSASIDPYQFLPVLLLGMNKVEQFVIDNLTTLSFQLFPDSYLEMEFYATGTSPTYLLADGKEIKERMHDEKSEVLGPQDKKKTNGCAVIGSLAAIALLITLLNKNK